MPSWSKHGVYSSEYCAIIDSIHFAGSREFPELLRDRLAVDVSVSDLVFLSRSPLSIDAFHLRPVGFVSGETEQGQRFIAAALEPVILVLRKHYTFTLLKNCGIPGLIIKSCLASQDHNSVILSWMGMKPVFSSGGLILRAGTWDYR